jgi:hypothetical protein
MATKEELLERAKELDVEGRSSMNKEELEKAVADAEGGSSSEGDEHEANESSEAGANEAASGDSAESSSGAEGAGEGADSPASDENNPEVVENLSPSGQEALENMEPEQAAEADLALDASGPLHLEDPAKRVMTGAVSEDHAKEQEKLLAGAPDDFVGDVSEAGFNDDGTPASGGPAYRSSEMEAAKSDPDKTVGELRRVGDLKQEDVIDYPEPHAAEEDTSSPQLAPVNSPFANSTVIGSNKRVFEQKGVFYTDGLSGQADSNLERAYEIPELLQSNNPAEREAGDESLSEAAQEEKSDEEKAEADRVKSGERD